MATQLEIRLSVRSRDLENCKAICRKEKYSVTLYFYYFQFFHLISTNLNTGFWRPRSQTHQLPPFFIKEINNFWWEYIKAHFLFTIQVATSTKILHTIKHAEEK